MPSAHGLLLAWALLPTVALVGKHVPPSETLSPDLPRQPPPDFRFCSWAAHTPSGAHTSCDVTVLGACVHRCACAFRPLVLTCPPTSWASEEPADPLPPTAPPPDWPGCSPWTAARHAVTGRKMFPDSWLIRNTFSRSELGISTEQGLNKCSAQRGVLWLHSQGCGSLCGRPMAAVMESAAPWEGHTWPRLRPGGRAQKPEMC